MKVHTGIKRSNHNMDAEISMEIIEEIQHILKKVEEDQSIIEKVDFSLLYRDNRKDTELDLVKRFENNDVSVFGIKELEIVLGYYEKYDSCKDGDFIRLLNENLSIIDKTYDFMDSLSSYGLMANMVKNVNQELHTLQSKFKITVAKTDIDIHYFVTNISNIYVNTKLIEDFEHGKVDHFMHEDVEKVLLYYHDNMTFLRYDSIKIFSDNMKIIFDDYNEHGTDMVNAINTYLNKNNSDYIIKSYRHVYSIDYVYIVTKKDEIYTKKAFRNRCPFT